MKNYFSANTGVGFVYGKVKEITPDMQNIVVTSEERVNEAKNGKANWVTKTVDVPIRSDIPLTDIQVGDDIAIAYRRFQEMVQQNINGVMQELPVPVYKSYGVIRDNNGYFELPIGVDKNGQPTVWGFLVGTVSKTSEVKTKTGRDMFSINVTVEQDAPKYEAVPVTDANGQTTYTAAPVIDPATGLPVREVAKVCHQPKNFRMANDNGKYDGLKKSFERIPVSDVPCVGAFVVDAVKDSTDKNGRVYPGYSAFATNEGKVIITASHVGLRSSDLNRDPEKVREYQNKKASEQPQQTQAPVQQNGYTQVSSAVNNAAPVQNVQTPVQNPQAAPVQTPVQPVMAQPQVQAPQNPAPFAQPTAPAPQPQQYTAPVTPVAPTTPVAPAPQVQAPVQPTAPVAPQVGMTAAAPVVTPEQVVAPQPQADAIPVIENDQLLDFDEQTMGL